MKKGHVRLSMALGMLTACGPLFAQDAPEPEETQDIVVNGTHQALPGAVVGDIPPELQYSPADIRAYGVNSVADLLNELAPETTSARGRGGEAPAVLLNGRRISSFSEIRDLPTEAILRVDILPEEVALKYGYSADQKVVNIVLRRRFRALTTEDSGSTSTDGGGASGIGDFTLTRIHGDDRLNIDAKVQGADSLLESDRGLTSQSTGRAYDRAGNVVATDGSLNALGGANIAGVGPGATGATPTTGDFNPNVANVTDISPYRTLTPATREATLNAVLAHPFSRKVTGTLNATFDASQSDTLRGLAGSNILVPSTDPFNPFGEDIALYRYLGSDPLKQRTQSISGHLGGTLNADVAKWRLNFTANYDYAQSVTRTQTGIDIDDLNAALAAGDATLNPFGTIPASLIGGTLTTRARGVSNSGNVQFVGNGPLFDLPAGALSTTVKVGLTASGFHSTSTRFGTTQETSLSRRDGSAQFNFDLPLTSRKKHVLGAIGDLTANANVAVDQLSDFGTLWTVGYGANWTPRDGISFIASATHDRGAPTIQQLGNPVIVTPGARVFDYRTGQTVDVTQIAGGNPDLKADSRHVEKFGTTLKPFKKTDITFTANYIHSTIRNAIAALPSPTAAIEAAFPDRFTRNDDGDLTAIDTRPVNLYRERRDELRWGFNFTQKLKTSKAVVDAFRQLRESGAFRRPPGGGDAPPGGGGTGGPPPGGGDGGSPPGGGGGWSGGRGGGGGGGGRGGFGGGAGGRLQLSVYHTWYFRDDILTRPGGPMLDLLDGGTSGSGGGQPRHDVQVQLGVTNNGIGVRLTGDWQSATTVDGGTGSATGDLHFSSLATANLRLFADLGANPSLMKHKWARGMRVTLALNNITNSRQHVRDANGDTPLSYQPAYLDPMGRTIKVSIRKLFF
ncbi:TonB-dependent receptor [Sphingomonas oryzagri]|uniref:TonB-dependent receptor n=1 Tax=Sphingomonas oryzagri TaxID=3042314 RepID=A0ABT6MW35_9SPHN|nr:TonB-dependent receptor [Sphingomonas oryzagri]MDH7637230.1 TonB-dependent receptor [Sphingomonas oryzagri]